MRALSMLLVAVVLTGCAGMIQNTPTANLSLTSVQRPEKAKARYGPEKLTVVTDSGITKYAFEDSLIRALVYPVRTGFAVRLDNKTDHTVKVMWDEAAIVGVTGASGRVMHLGVKYIDRNNSQPPTVIVAHGHIFDELSPTENSEFSTYGGWVTSSLLPMDTYTSKDRDAVLAKMRTLYKGKTVQLLLPLSIEDVTNDYLFTFTVDDVNAVSLVSVDRVINAG